MTTDNAAGPADGTYSFAVTCYRRQPGDRGGWSSVASGEMHPYDAADWIAQRVTECERDGLHAVVRVSTAPPLLPEGNDQAAAAPAVTDAPSAADLTEVEPL